MRHLGWIFGWIFFDEVFKPERMIAGGEDDGQGTIRAMGWNGQQ